MQSEGGHEWFMLRAFHLMLLSDRVSMFRAIEMHITPPNPVLPADERMASLQ